VHLVGFIIRIYHDARSPERQKRTRTVGTDTATLRQPVLTCAVTSEFEKLWCTVVSRATG